MKQSDAEQLELFSGDYAAPQRQNTTKTFLRLHSRHEKIAIGAISYIVVAVVAFSFGIKKGKQLTPTNLTGEILATTQKQTTPVLSPANQALTQPVKPPALPSQPKTPLPVTVKPPAVLSPTISVGGYAIQVASFKKTQNANEEIARLKGKGFNGYLITKGSYVVVLVGNFINKAEADVYLSKLKRQYTDCLIKKL